MLAQVLDGVSSEPLSGSLLQPRHEVENKELVFEDEVIPVRYCRFHLRRILVDIDRPGKLM